MTICSIIACIADVDLLDELELDVLFQLFDQLVEVRHVLRCAAASAPRPWHEQVHHGLLGAAQAGARRRW